MVDRRGANRDNYERGETRWEKTGGGKHEEGNLKLRWSTRGEQ